MWRKVREWGKIRGGRGRWMPGASYVHFVWLIRELISNHNFEWWTSTGSGLYAMLGHDVDQIFTQIISMREKTLTNTNLVALRHFERKNATFPVDVRRSNTSLLKLNNFCILPSSDCNEIDGWKKTASNIWSAARFSFHITTGVPNWL